MGVDIETLIKEVQALSPDDQRRVREALGQSALVPIVPDTAEDAFERELAEQGLISLPQPPTSPPPPRRLVTIIGKPLSETIIEERR